MMNDLGGVLEQDLGDFVFESDAQSLQRILDNKALSPTTLGYGKQIEKTSNKVMPTLTPAKHIPSSMKKHKDKYEFFEAKNGMVFCRTRNKDTISDGGSITKNRGFGRDKLKGVMPVRSTKPPTVPAKLNKSPSKPSANPLPANSKLYKKNEHAMHRKQTDLCKSEKRIVPFALPLPRQSISERKAVPHLDKMNTFIPRPKVSSLHSKTKYARKELNFNEGFQAPVAHQLKGKQKMNRNADSNGEDSFDFVKPLDVGDTAAPSKNKSSNKTETNSLAKMIMMRESLAGLPKESIGGLFRQSLSLAELDRLFEDDSTQSFENLEGRLKTPMRRGIRKVTDPDNEILQNSENSKSNEVMSVPVISITAPECNDEKDSNELTDKDPLKSPSSDLKLVENENFSKEFVGNTDVEQHVVNVDDLVEDNSNWANQNYFLEKGETKMTSDGSIVQIYEIEYSDSEEFNQNDSINVSSLLQRTLSLNDLQSFSADNFNIEIGNGIVEQLADVSLPRSISNMNLTEAMSTTSLEPVIETIDSELNLAENLAEENDFLKQAEADLEMYRQEQVILFPCINPFFVSKFAPSPQFDPDI